MSQPYYVHLHKTAAVFYENNVYAIDDNQNIHVYSVIHKKWNLLDENIFNWK